MVAAVFVSVGSPARKRNPMELRDLEQIIPGESETAQRLREVNWTNAGVMSPQDWPPALRTAIAMCLNASEPIVLWWGPRFLFIYNDACIPVLGDKHPAVLAQHGREAWGHDWEHLEPLIRATLARGEATSVEGCYFTPLYGVESVDGVIGIGWPRVAAKIQSQGRRVLVVEDNDDEAHALKHALELLGYSVSLAHDGPVALTVARSFDAEIAVIDTDLPVMDGFELTRRLHEQHARLKIVSASASHSEIEEQRSADAGCVAHTTKPYDVTLLAELLARVLASV